MEKEIWNDKTKLSLADKIIDQYFNRNFGRLSKSDLETLLFSEYLNAHDGVEVPCDDYTISKDLGITQSRVRALKERKELVYPSKNFDWERDFAQCIKHVHFDRTQKKVMFLVDDVNVMIELNHCIEQKGWFNECTLNKKVMVLSPEYFLELCSEKTSLAEIIKGLGNKDIQKQIRTIKFENSYLNKLLENLSTGNFAEFVRKTSFDGIQKVVSLLPAAKEIKDSLVNMCKFICLKKEGEKEDRK